MLPRHAALCLVAILTLLPGTVQAQDARRAVLVTGATSGIGRATAELLAERGFFVYAGARSAELGAPVAVAAPEPEPLPWSERHPRLLLAMLFLGQPRRGPAARPLGSPCAGDLECRVGMSCADLDGVLSGQCSATCNSDAACRDEFGDASMCIGADRCVRTCASDAECTEGTDCNAYGWCEASD